MSTVKQHLSADVARAVRYGDREGEQFARRALATASIEAAIQKALAKAPPLSNQQIHKLTSLLRTGGQR